jgi:hypothetical protein
MYFEVHIDLKPFIIKFKIFVYIYFLNYKRKSSWLAFYSYNRQIILMHY